MALLTQEMENMIIEGKLLKEAEAGPLGTSVKMAKDRKARKELERGRLSEGSPLRPTSPARIPSTPSRKLAVARPLGSPIPVIHAAEGYVRARSQSC